MTNDELFEQFKIEWEAASKVSPNLKWAIFPLGDPQLELQAAHKLLKMFENVSGILFTENDKTPEQIIEWAKSIQKQYEEKPEHDLVKAAEESGYVLHKGS